MQAYWQVGRLIVEQEQQRNRRAAYGKQQLQQLRTLDSRLHGNDSSKMPVTVSSDLCDPFRSKWKKMDIDLRNKRKELNGQLAELGC